MHNIFTKAQNNPSLRKCYCLVADRPIGIVEGTVCATIREALTLAADRKANGEAFPNEWPMTVGEACRNYQSLYLGA